MNYFNVRNTRIVIFEKIPSKVIIIGGKDDVHFWWYKYMIGKIFKIKVQSNDSLHYMVVDVEHSGAYILKQHTKIIS